MEKPNKFIYHFSTEQTEGSKNLGHLLGGKGAHLAEMTSMGIPVPPGFTITSEMNLYFHKNKKTLPDFFQEQVRQSVQVLEKRTGLSFGSAKNPLLVSVRSGAEVSMPGMMDTILNLGLNVDIVKQMAQKDARWAWDCYRRLIQMYGDVVLGADASMFVFFMEDYKSKKKYKSDADLTAKDLEELSLQFKEQVLEMTGEEFPEDPEKQLFGAVSAVFDSWNNSRAVAYRELNSYSHRLGTAVNVQTMVFGNRCGNSATGVLFTRNPATGEPQLFGEFLQQAQGEDVVAGIRTPLPICQAEKSLETLFPSVFKELEAVSKKLEKHFKNMQDIEFTVEGGRLWILQTRLAKRSVRAALRTTVDFVKEGILSEEEAVMSIPPKELEKLLHPAIDPQKRKNYLCKGLPASPGGAAGFIVFSSAAAVEKSHEKVILVRDETSPDDIKGMISAQGVLTTRGGMTSHAAVVARGMGKCCVVGCSSVQIDREKRECRVSGKILKEGDKITLDGSTGEVYLGEAPMIQPKLDQYFYDFMQMADRYSPLKVKANADTPKDAETAKSFGAKGIGLCRTEHMFFQEDCLDIMRKMILFQDDSEKRLSHLDSLLAKQKKDFFDIFRVMEGESVCIRLLDPPLHEFLPQSAKEIEELAVKWSEDVKNISEKVKSLRELNPMLGHRGCRLAVTFPELYQAQVRAAALAYVEMVRKNKKCFPEIMIPLVGAVKEFVYIRDFIRKTLNPIEKKLGVSLNFPIGTMIELPQAALCSEELAKEADFFSYGSNDLTQTVLGISRDDCGRFLPEYMNKELVSADPFVQIEEKSVGWLIAFSAKCARKIRSDFPLGLCGEHGADPLSIDFLNQTGLNSVSCSPYRIPVAKTAAAQSFIQNQMEKRHPSNRELSV